MLKSLESLRLCGYEGPVSVLSNLGAEGWERRGVLDYEVRHLRPEHDCVKFGGKTVIHKYVQARKVLVMDCDTVVVGALHGVWEALDRADIALVPDIFPTVWDALANDLRYKPSNSHADMRETVERCGTDGAYYNSGVLGFRAGPSAERLFPLWYREWAKYKTSNQYALVRALKETQISVARLPRAYNADARLYSSRRSAVEKGVKILHFFGTGPKAMFNY